MDDSLLAITPGEAEARLERWFDAFGDRCGEEATQAAGRFIAGIKEAIRRGIPWYAAFGFSAAFNGVEDPFHHRPTLQEIYFLGCVNSVAKPFSPGVSAVDPTDEVVLARVRASWLLFDWSTPEFPRVLKRALRLVEPWRLACAVRVWAPDPAVYSAYVDPARRHRRRAALAKRNWKEFGAGIKRLNSKGSLISRWWMPVDRLLTANGWRDDDKVDLITATGWSLPLGPAGTLGLKNRLHVERRRAGGLGMGERRGRPRAWTSS